MKYKQYIIVVKENGDKMDELSIFFERVEKKRSKGSECAYPFYVSESEYQNRMRYVIKMYNEKIQAYHSLRDKYFV